MAFRSFEQTSSERKQRARSVGPVPLGQDIGFLPIERIVFYTDSVFKIRLASFFVTAESSTIAGRLTQ